MKTSSAAMLSAAFAGLISMGFCSAAGAAESQTIDAFSAWQGRGQMFATGEDEATFVGAFMGLIYIESKEGPLDAGYMICPGVLQIEVSSAKQAGNGRCTITTEEGARAYSTWECRGTHLKGCDGTFTFTGGSGRLSGLSGGGPISLRSRMHVIANEIPGNTVQESAAGIAVWRGLKLQLP